MSKRVHLTDEELEIILDWLERAENQGEQAYYLRKWAKISITNLRRKLGGDNHD